MEATLAALPGISLTDLTERAALQTRVDRKYLVTTPIARDLLGELAGTVAALDIDGRRLHGYSSVYFDTDDLLCFREHRQGRRRRFKVRTRTYTDSGECLLEVKAVGPRGQTIKDRLDYPPTDAGRLTSSAREFVADRLDRHPAVSALRATAVTDYRRATLLEVPTGCRLTIDVGLEFAGPARRVPAPADTVIVETKSPGAPGLADMALRRLGARATSVSKYCVAVAVLHPERSANRWHRVLRRHFGVEPQGSRLVAA